MKFKTTITKFGKGISSIFKKSEPVGEMRIPKTTLKALERIKKHSPRDYKIIMKRLRKEFST